MALQLSQHLEYHSSTYWVYLLGSLWMEGLAFMIITCLCAVPMEELLSLPLAIAFECVLFIMKTDNPELPVKARQLCL